MRKWFSNAFDVFARWYRETHTSSATGMLSNRSQAYSFVILSIMGVLVYDGIKAGVRRDWTEAAVAILAAVTTGKVWKRGVKSDPKPVEQNTGPG